MYPILFRFGGFTITSYGVMLVVAFIAAGWVVQREFKRVGWDAQIAQDVVLAAMVGGVVGSKLFWAFNNWARLAADPVGTLFSRGGFTFYGGLIGGILSVLFLFRMRKLPLGKAVNLATPAVPVGYMLGRVGCFLVGDDYGRPSDVPWAIAFPEGSPPTTVPVHPTQIYEILLTVPIFLYLWSRRKREMPGGYLLFQFLILAGVERFAIEFIRVNPKVALGITVAQWISVALVAIGIAGVVRVRGRIEASRQPA